MGEAVQFELPKWVQALDVAYVCFFYLAHTATVSQRLLQTWTSKSMPGFGCTMFCS